MIRLRKRSGMELVYLWVEKYKNIEKQGFNFSPRFRCEYDPIENKLTIDENEDYVDIFPDNINVTAIVGKNGSGKSSIISLLTNIDHSLNMLKLYNENGIFYLDRTPSINERIIVFFNKKQILLEERNLKNTLYYTDNISTNSIQNNSCYNMSLWSELDNIIDNGNDCFKFYYAIDEKKKETILFELLLIKNLSFIPGIKKIPEYIIFSLNHHYLDEIACLKDTLSITIGIMYIILEDSYYSSSKLYDDFFDLIEFSNKITSLSNLEEELLSTNEELYKIYIDIVSPFIFEYSNILNVSKVNENNLHIPTKDLTTNFISNLHLLIRHESFISLKWGHELSSGEFSFLRFFAILYKNIKQNLLSSENFIIVVDEIETYLHPNWQKEVLNLIIDFFVLNNVKLEGKVHIIITTHSPFLLSDIPKQNIIFLDTYEGNESEVLNKNQKVGNCKVVNGLNEKKETFGANIHTLLSDGFFMEGGFMGKFASNIINQTITKLNQKNLSNDDISFCEKVLSIIGEPIIKRQLQKILDSKRLAKLDQIDEIQKQMTHLQQKIIELQNND